MSTTAPGRTPAAVLRLRATFEICAEDTMMRGHDVKAAGAYETRALGWLHVPERPHRCQSASAYLSHWKSRGALTRF
jgi:hypothetical protein